MLRPGLHQVVWGLSNRTPAGCWEELQEPEASVGRAKAQPCGIQRKKSANKNPHNTMTKKDTFIPITQIGRLRLTADNWPTQVNRAGGLELVSLQCPCCTCPSGQNRVRI